jgi:hypothetical protein
MQTTGAQTGGATMMETWITCEELCKLWNINKYTLAQIVFDGKLQSFVSDDFSALYFLDGGSYKESPDGQTTSILRHEPFTIDEVTNLIFRISDVEAYEKKGALKKNKQLIVTDYIQRRRTEGIKDEVIAFELHDTDGQFKLSHLNVAKALGLDEGLNEKQYDAIKQRGKRAWDKGKALFKKK